MNKQEAMLRRLGSPMSRTVDIHLNQIILIDRILFSVTLLHVPESIDTMKMSEIWIHKKLQRGYDEYGAGKHGTLLLHLINSRKNIK